MEPKTQTQSKPSVSVVKSKNPTDGTVTAACLVKDFYPKSVTVTVNQESNIVYESKEAILSSDGKYNMVKVVKVDSNAEVTCAAKHEGEFFNETATIPATVPPPTVKVQICESSNSTEEEPSLDNVNMLSVTVLGLRVLLAKSIAFNTLMTIKLFIF